MIFISFGGEKYLFLFFFSGRHVKSLSASYLRTTRESLRVNKVKLRLICLNVDVDVMSRYVLEVRLLVTMEAYYRQHAGRITGI